MQKEHDELYFNCRTNAFRSINLAKINLSKEDFTSTIIQSPSDEVTEKSLSRKYFHRATSESIGSVDMFDVVDEYNFNHPDEIPEWHWLNRIASFEHKGNGMYGVYEVIVNLANFFENSDFYAEIPEKLISVFNDAKQNNLSYIIFHQGN